MLTDIRALADHFLIALPNINNYNRNLFLTLVRIIYCSNGEAYGI